MTNWAPPRSPHADPTDPDAGPRRCPRSEIARTKTKPEALAALDRWSEAHPAVAVLLRPADVLVDGMRGSSSLWYRVRVNLQHVPEEQRPAQEPLLAEYDPWAGKT